MQDKNLKSVYIGLISAFLCLLAFLGIILLEKI